ncbi:MAG: hypothetical protein DHS20C16_27950 [Phycisphaerae bacterium]|nr:MAG: hypothetical protein DHS20C16_27950 [Phycisphaerae bacterium]
MDHRPNVSNPPSTQPAKFVSGKMHPAGQQPLHGQDSVRASKAVEIDCDQAIFTSQKSPMGEGYRIVAASPGIRPDEKAEITRRSPSHGSLTSDSTQSEGMLAYPLPSGRYCVCHCKHDGVEHTARGGQRVRTHVAILDPKDFRKFDDNPFSVDQALARVPVEAARAFNPTMGRLHLKAADPYTPPRHLANKTGPDIFLKVIRALVGEEPCILASVPETRPTLQWAMMMVPMSMRAKRSFSVGVKYSQARNISTSIIHHDLERVHQMVAGQPIQWRDVSSDTPVRQDLFVEWLSFVGKRADQGRLVDVSKLTNQMTELTTQIALSRIAKISLDRDAVITLDEEALMALQREYQSFAARDEIEEGLAETLRAHVDQRIAELEEARRREEEANAEGMASASHINRL